MPNPSILESEDREADVHRHGGDSTLHVTGMSGLWSELSAMTNAFRAMLAERDDLRSQLETALALKADYFSECCALRAGLQDVDQLLARIAELEAKLASAMSPVGW